MARNRTLAVAFITAALVSAAASNQLLSAAGTESAFLAPQGGENVTGTWEIEIDVPGNPMPLRGTFTQKDKVVTGKISSALGENDVTGSMEGAAFRVSFVGSGGVTVSLNGTLKGDTLTGKATMTGQDEELDWTGKRAAK